MPFCSPLGHPNDADEVDDFIDTLWDYANKQETVFVDTEQLGKLGVNAEFDIDIDDFKPFYFKLLPVEDPDCYRITERQKTPGDRIEIENYEPKKRRWEFSDVREMGPGCTRRSSGQMFV